MNPWLPVCLLWNDLIWVFPNTNKTTTTGAVPSHFFFSLTKRASFSCLFAFLKLPIYSTFNSVWKHLIPLLLLPKIVISNFEINNETWKSEETDKKKKEKRKKWFKHGSAAWTFCWISDPPQQNLKKKREERNFLFFFFSSFCFHRLKKLLTAHLHPTTVTRFFIQWLIMEPAIPRRRFLLLLQRLNLLPLLLPVQLLYLSLLAPSMKRSSLLASAWASALVLWLLFLASSLIPMTSNLFHSSSPVLWPLLPPIPTTTNFPFLLLNRVKTLLLTSVSLPICPSFRRRLCSIYLRGWVLWLFSILQASGCYLPRLVSSLALNCLQYLSAFISFFLFYKLFSFICWTLLNYSFFSPPFFFLCYINISEII